MNWYTPEACAGFFPYPPKGVKHLSCLAVTKDEDGVHLLCLCGWGQPLGFYATVQDATTAFADHLALTATADAHAERYPPTGERSVNLADTSSSMGGQVTYLASEGTDQ